MSPGQTLNCSARIRSRAARDRNGSRPVRVSARRAEDSTLRPSTCVAAGVDPKGGWPKAHEVMIEQGEFYGDPDDKGMVSGDSKRMMDERPDFVVFNGVIDNPQLSRTRSLAARSTARSCQPRSREYRCGDIQRVSPGTPAPISCRMLPPASSKRPAGCPLEDDARPRRTQHARSGYAIRRALVYRAQRLGLKYLPASTVMFGAMIVFGLVASIYYVRSPQHASASCPRRATFIDRARQPGAAFKDEASLGRRKPAKPPCPRSIRRPPIRGECSRCYWRRPPALHSAQSGMPRPR